MLTWLIYPADPYGPAQNILETELISQVLEIFWWDSWLLENLELTGKLTNNVRSVTI